MIIKNMYLDEEQEDMNNEDGECNNFEADNESEFSII